MKLSAEKINHVFDLFKNMITFVFIIYVGFYLFSHYDVTPKSIVDSLAEDICEKKLKAEAKQKVKQEGAIPRNNAIDSTKQTPTLIYAAKVVDSLVNNGQPSWVYIGDFTGTQIFHNNFSLAHMPLKGDVITANVPVFKRKDVPMQIGTNKWKFGEIKGVVEKGESVKIDSVYQIPNDVNYYGRIVE